MRSQEAVPIDSVKGFLIALSKLDGSKIFDSMKSWQSTRSRAAITRKQRPVVESSRVQPQAQKNSFISPATVPLERERQVFVEVQLEWVFLASSNGQYTGQWLHGYYE